MGIATQAVTLEDLDRWDALHAGATSGRWNVGHPPPNGQQTIGSRGLLLAVTTTYDQRDKPNAEAIVALHNAWPAVSAQLRQALPQAAPRLEGGVDAQLREAAWTHTEAAADKAPPAPPRLPFGPWFEGERHAVAEDGKHYSLFRLLDGCVEVRLGFTVFAERRTEEDAIDLANSHNVLRLRKAGGA